MASSVLFGIGLLALLFGWRFIITPTLVDHYRDKLFDLRDEVRMHYVEQPGGLGSADYKALRDLLNSQILYIERASIFFFSYLLATAKNDPDTHEAFRSTALSRLEREPAGSFSHQVRDKAAMVVLDYCAKASLAIWVLASLAGPFVAIYEVVNGLVDHGLRALRSVPKIEFAPAVVAFLGLLGLQGQYKPTIGAVIEKAARDNAQHQVSLGRRQQLVG